MGKAKTNTKESLLHVDLHEFVVKIHDLDKDGEGMVLDIMGRLGGGFADGLHDEMPLTFLFEIGPDPAQGIIKRLDGCDADLLTRLLLPNAMHDRGQDRARMLLDIFRALPAVNVMFQKERRETNEVLGDETDGMEGGGPMDFVGGIGGALKEVLHQLRPLIRRQLNKGHMGNGHGGDLRSERGLIGEHAQYCVWSERDHEGKKERLTSEFDLRFGVRVEGTPALRELFALARVLRTTVSHVGTQEQKGGKEGKKEGKKTLEVKAFLRAVPAAWRVPSACCGLASTATSSSA